MAYRERIETKLREQLAPTYLELRDESHKHRGHSGWSPEGETHFALTVVAAAFEGESRVNRQRRIHRLLADELAEHVHALQIRALAPSEAA